MSTPTEQLAHLSLESHSAGATMASPEEVRERLVLLQDILSSFFDKLPTEFEPQIVGNIQDNMSKPYQNRPKDDDWTISGNLPGTLLHWGAYTDEAWNFLRKIRPANALAHVFIEKLGIRFKRCLDEYDEIINNPPTAAELKQRMLDLTDKFMHLSNTLARDLERRKDTEDISIKQHEAHSLEVALGVLNAVCQRTQDVVPTGIEMTRRSSRRTASNSNTHPSLFSTLIKQGPKQDDSFLLASFEQFSGAALKEWLDKLKQIDLVLDRNGAPNDYIKRFEALQLLANNESEASTAPKLAGGSRGRGGGLEAEPRAGSKRPQPAVEATPKRGKRSGGK